MVKRPGKVPKLLETVREHVAAGTYGYSEHAFQRQDQRVVTDFEVREVLLKGWHEARKDVFREDFKSWTYSIRGSTLDGRALRVVVAFSDGLLIVTVVDLDA